MQLSTAAVGACDVPTAAVGNYSTDQCHRGASAPLDWMKFTFAPAQENPTPNTEPYPARWAIDVNA
jgi:hypothetical protein